MGAAARGMRKSEMSPIDPSLWLDSGQEPHAIRRDEIIKRHPEVKQLFGPDPLSFLFATVLVAMQLTLIFSLASAPWWLVVATATLVGSICNHGLMQAIHECAHGLVFGRSRRSLNDALAIACNLPIGMPCAIAFRRYHSEHHRALNECSGDPGMPSAIESRIFWRNRLGKCLWVLWQGPLYMLRPLWVSGPEAPNARLLINQTLQVSFNATVFFLLGYKSFYYMFASTFIGMGPHPIGCHYIAEHYMWKRGTLSYYGAWNPLAWNIGYHNEHHDFPYVSAWRLPTLRSLAPEFYRRPNAGVCTSWFATVLDFIGDDDFDARYHPGVKTNAKMNK